MVKEEKGQSLVEMALLLPLLLLLLVGIFDLGRVMYTQMHLHLATQETVRLGGLGASDVEMAEFVQDYVHVGDVTLLEVIISPSEMSRVSGEYITVTVQYPIEFFTPFVSNFLPSAYKMTAASTIRIE